MSDFVARLQAFLQSRNNASSYQQLTPDASTREYFRVEWENGTAIVCIYPEPFVAGEQSYLDVTNLFIRSRLPVAPILDFDESLGAIAIADFGDRILREELLASGPERREALVDSAIDLI